MELAEIAVDRFMELHPLIRRNLMDLDRAGKRGEMTGTHLGILFVLRHQGPHTMGELCTHMNFARPHMTALVDRLISLGLASRGQDEGDRRQVHVSITAAGLAQLDEFVAEMKQEMAERLSVLSPQDLEELVAAIIKMVEILGKMHHGKEFV